MIHYLERFEEAVKKNWNQHGLSNFKGESFTFGEIATEIEKLHIIFRENGIKKGDKIALCSKNNARWCIAFFAVTSYGSVVVPILNDFLPESVQSLTDHSESMLLFTEKSIFSQIDPEKMPLINGIINIEETTALFSRDGKLTKAIENLNTLFETAHPNGFKAEDIKYSYDNLDDLTLISYTSGTTSSPEGVMLTARSLSSNREFAIDSLPVVPGETIVSMLPLAHMYGLAFELIYPLTSGCHVYLLGKLPTPALLLQAFAEVKPYLIITVPLVLEKIIKGKVIPTIEKPLFKVLLAIPGINNLLYSTINKKLMAAFGGNVRKIVAGGAAIAENVEIVMRKLKLPYTVGYGMTECGPLIGYRDPATFKARSCGETVTRMEVRIDSDDPQNIVGEIQTRGENVMLGYYKNPDATSATFTDDGWLKTGDLGVVDNDGNIFIKGRSKSMILSANGQNIYPEEIEDKLNSLPLVAESIIVDREKKLVALVVPDYEKAAAESIEGDALAKIMEENRNKLNGMLPSYSRVTKIELQKEAFEKTPKKSIKRFKYS
jgi:long-chain acyl-CoA synthetase